MAVSGRTYLSIGDVLSLLREEFPDVTISKIRFLESQGLVDPERSPSGYRKFYEHDVARLRWVLRAQRDHFLPLKVIRDRLRAAGNGVPSDEDWAEAAAAAAADVEGPAGTDAGTARTTGTAGLPSVGAPAGTSAPPPGHHVPGEPNGIGDPRLLGAAEPNGAATSDPAEATLRAYPPEPSGQPEPSLQPEPVQPSPLPAPAQAGAPTSPAHAAPLHAASTDPGRGAGQGASPVQAQETTTGPSRTAGPPDRLVPPQDATRVPPGTRPSGSAPAAYDLGPETSGVSLTREELCAATGLSPQDLVQLEGLGLVAAMSIGGTAIYDEEALTVGKLTAEFARFGIEPRHLRLYRNAADREAGLIEQVIMPLLRQRNPEARQRAVDAAAQLARLGQTLRASLVRSALRGQLGS